MLILVLVINSFDIWLCTGAIGTVQVILSLAKLSNQSSIGLLIRSAFSGKRGAQMMQISSSNLLIAQSIGAGVAGFLLSVDFIYIGQIIASFLFLLSYFSIKFFEKENLNFSCSRNTKSGNVESALQAMFILNHKDLQTLVLFSICSSGTLQYINSILAPLAAKIVENEPFYFSLLDILCTVGGFLAGVFLSTKRVKTSFVLSYSFAIIALFSVFLSLFEEPIIVAILIFFLSLTTTSHVICMQVKTNQVPSKKYVAKYAVIRSASVSIAKTVFALIAGTLTNYISIQSAWFVLGGIAIVFTVLWILVQPEWQDNNKVLKKSY